MSYIILIFCISDSGQSNAFDVRIFIYEKKKHWTVQYGLIMEQMSRLWCGVRHQSFCRSMLLRAEPERNQASRTEQTTLTAVLFLFLSPSLLCNKTMTAQSLPSKSCVGGTKRPMATGEWNERNLNWKPWLYLSTATNHPHPSPSSAHINKQKY